MRPLSTRLSRGALAIVLTVAVTALGVSLPAAASGRDGDHGHHHGAVPGVRGVDHFGITVADVAQARAWFEEVVGCVVPLRFGPFSDPTGTFMQDLLDVHPRAVVNEINQVRCGTGSSIELLEYTSPDQRTTFARNSDLAGHHIAFYVEDIAAAAAYLEARGVKKFLGPVPITDGPPAGQTINYFQAPFGLYVELISYPDGMAYEATARTRLWNAHDIGATAWNRGIPGLLGVDHFGITVPDAARTARWLKRNMGCSAPLSFGPLSDPTGTFMQDLVDVHPRAVIEQVIELRCGHGANIELFQYSSPDQDTTFAKNSDLAGHHIAFYVDDIDAAVRALARRRGSAKLLGPLPVTEGPAAGQTINYFRTTFGTYVELISYPDGMAYEATAEIPLWSPKDVPLRHRRHCH